MSRRINIIKPVKILFERNIFRETQDYASAATSVITHKPV